MRDLEDETELPDPDLQYSTEVLRVAPKSIRAVQKPACINTQNKPYYNMLTCVTPLQSNLQDGAELPRPQSMKQSVKEVEVSSQPIPDSTPTAPESPRGMALEDESMSM